MTAVIPASAHARRAAQADHIARLFAEGHDLTTVCQQGQVNGWNRMRVLEVVSQRGWQLDASGRVPRAQRPAVTPGQPVPAAPSGMPGVGTIGGQRPVVERPAPSPGRAQIAALAGQQTPTEKVAAASPPRGTAPESSEKAAAVTPDDSTTGHGTAGPDAQPQLSPSRTTAGNTRGGGASDAPAASPGLDLPALQRQARAAQDREVAALLARITDGATVTPQEAREAFGVPGADALLTRAADSQQTTVINAAAKVRDALEELRQALAVDGEIVKLQDRLAEIAAERRELLARLEELQTSAPTPAAPLEVPAPPKAAAPTKAAMAKGEINHGTWGGFLKHRYRGETADQIHTACPPCYEAKASRGRS